MIRTDSKGWNVPYCTDCLSHAECAHHADRTRVTDKAAASAIIAGSVTVGIATAVLGTCCITPMLGGIFGGQNTAASSTTNTVSFVIGLAFSALVGLIIAVIGSVRGTKALAAADRKHRRQMEQVENSLRPTCCAIYHAVAYGGWSGSIHAFQFWNPHFAEAFKQANGKKVI